MQHQKDRPQEGAHWLRRPWLPFTAVALVAVLLLIGQPLFAANAQPTINQTVPPATPRPTVETPNDDNNDDNNDNNNDNNNNSGNNSGATDTGSTSQPADAAATTGDVVQTASLTSTSGLTATVNVLALNVRQGPGTTFPVVGKFAQGATVSVEARNAAGDWLLVCCIPGTTTPGWVSASLILPGFTADQGAVLPVSDGTVSAAPLAATATPAPVATPVPGSKPGVVAGVNLNVRQGPGTDSLVAGKLRANDSVSVLGRNATGDWLYICCIGDPPANGWVSAQFITPAFAAGDLAEVTAGAPVAPAAPAATATPAPQSAATTQATGEAGASAAAPATAGGLSVSIAQQPPFAVQGREVALVYTVRNDGSTDLADVVLSSELPGPLTLVGATAAGAVAQQDGASVEITWPSLAAGESATATVRVRVADDVPNGATFANLATVSAGDESVANGITIGMPPALLPEFW